MRLSVSIIHAFTDGFNGGNPAGVVLDAGRYSREQCLEIGSALGLSETPFVGPSTIGDFKLDFYTPTRQIGHCGMQK